jgi:hypothetical protein
MPYLYHRDGYVLYKYFDGEFFYAFHPNAIGGYRNPRSAAAQKGLNLDDFINY